MIKSDFHTHTNFCDGKNTPTEMVKSAYNMGLTDYGVSGHAYITAGGEFGMNDDILLKYKNELYDLREKYKGKMNIYIGIELDVLGPIQEAEYSIGSCHCLEKNGKYVVIDNTEEILCNAVNKLWNGDWYSLTDDYYNLVSKVYDITKCDFVGHFDLITKFNQDYKHFDESDDRYLDSAYKAMKKLNSFDLPFEINTGAISRGYREEPYPNEILLRELKNMGGRIIINSDSHSVDNICYKFDEAVEIAKRCGFKTSWILKPEGGFREIPL